MKFAKELDQDAVPEWRTKYLNYKQGKKKLKAVSRALRTADRTPKLDGPSGTIWLSASGYRYENRNPSANPQDLRAIEAGEANGRGAPNWSSRPGYGTGQRSATESGSRPVPTERSALRESEPFRRPVREGMARYGSIIGSPPRDDSPAMESLAQETSTLELPNPAMDPDVPKDAQNRDLGLDLPTSHTSTQRQLRGPASQMGHTGNAYEINPPRDVPNLDGATYHNRSLQAPRLRGLFHPKRMNSLPSAAEHARRPLMDRILSMGQRSKVKQEDNDVALEAYREVDFRQAEFFIFLDKELDKVESFYQQKENDATSRIGVLREQLHVMRNQRLQEIVEAEKKKKRNDHALTELGLIGGDSANDSANDANSEFKPNGVGKKNTKDESSTPSTRPGTSNGPHRPRMASAPFIGTTMHHIDHAIDKIKPNHFGKTSAAMGDLGTPQLEARNGPDAPERTDTQQDYVRKAAHRDVAYRVAKRKLKIALAEFYRSLELLKSYSLVNRTAFRKINKKFDKAVNARPAGRYMSEKVNSAYFVTSEVVDHHLQAVEDLYARYFERGNHKVAVNKLRAKSRGDGDFIGSVWRQAIFATAGFIFAVQGVIYGSELLYESDDPTRVLTAYLLQLYGGYFLVLLLVSLFVFDCRVFAAARVNYQFIFEFDSRHNLNWRQLSEMPAVFLCLLGLTMLLNFQRVGGDFMYIYWPVVLVGLSVLLMFMPAPIFYYRSRSWFLYSIFRLSLAGIYPVEFRDFFLGDMFCSLTYAMGNISLFFCLYAHNWNEPPQCNSSHSRLLGFMACLPGIWRALQCLRRYYDTRNIFPHLVNCGKYTFTILSYMSLSLFRLNHSTHAFALFITFSTINSIYCSIWDVIMDWSLGDPYAKHRFLRPTLAYKTPALYYLAMLIDPILRFNWIFYAIFVHDVQHSGIIAFAIALSEVLRRGMWTLFRVENEHCTNMGRFRASRDVPLPYDVGKGEERAKLLERQQKDGIVDDEEQNFTGEEDDAGEAIDTAEELAHRDSRSTGADTARDRRSSSIGVGLAGVTAAHAVAHSLRRRQKSRQSGSSTAPSETPVLRALKRVGTTMLNAHAQDFERKRRPSEEQEDKGETDDDEEEGIEAERERELAVARADEEEEVRDAKERKREERRRRESRRRRKGRQGSGSGSGSGGEESTASNEPDVNERPGAPLQAGPGDAWAGKGPMGEAEEAS